MEKRYQWRRDVLEGLVANEDAETESEYAADSSGKSRMNGNGAAKSEVKEESEDDDDEL